MMENEKLKRAQIYIEKMANGVNPLTNQEIPEGELVNHVRISRCLFYVSDLLEQLIEKENIRKLQESGGKEKKAPFFLDCETRLKYPFSERPIPISELTNRINGLIDVERMVKLNYEHIANWLVEIGLLSLIIGADGRRSKVPTPKGIEFGISTEQRVGRNGVYTVTVYNREAQQFILDNLDAVIELQLRHKAEKKKKALLQGQPWSKEQDAVLIAMFERQVPMGEIAAALDRTRGGVEGRLKRLGLIDENSDRID